MEKLIPLDELLQIVTDAGLLHQRAFYETSLSRLIANGSDPLTELSTAYEVGAALGIPEERIRAVLALRYPEPEEQLAMLEAQGATATTRAVARTYQDQLLAALRRGLPSCIFEGQINRADGVLNQSYLKVKWHRDYTLAVMLKQTIEAVLPARRGWRNAFGLARTREETEERTESVRLATIQIGYELLPFGSGASPGAHSGRFRPGDRLVLVITVASGVFLKVCTSVLEDLRARFSRHNRLAEYEVIYDYVVG